MSDNCILVKFQYAFQVTQDEWKLEWVEKLFPLTVTVEEIRNWRNERTKQKDARLYEVIITEPEQYKKENQ